MSSDYEQITRDNIRKYGEEEHHLALLVRDLYSYRTHFIFELLQNAEDAGACKVKFSVFHDRLELVHNGSAFTAEDVRGVCGIGEGQKADDLTKIGRFGIGFKSVYAYTTSPEIHSRDEHFCINKYVRPTQAIPRRVDDPWTTLFVFPFNKDKPDHKAAICEITDCPICEITDCLSKLSTRTLLFLRRIKELEYTSVETSGATYLREESRHDTARKIELIGDKDDEAWLVFERPVKLDPNDDFISIHEPGSNHKVYVELGFRMNTKTKTIERESNTPLVVYFPTETSTGLSFYIQGPYQTTLARDNIPKDNPWNRKLIEETAELAVESLHKLKTMGLLTTSLLEALPIRSADFDDSRPESMFRLIFTRVRHELRNEELLPTDGGSFVAARNARLVRSAELMKLLDDKLLRSLLASDSVRWLPSDITQNSRETGDLWEYLIHELQVKEFTPDNFVEAVSEQFLMARSDDWICAFYYFVSERRALWDRASGKAILRLQDGTHVSPFRVGGRPNAYLPPAATDVSVPSVKRELTRRSEVCKFLEELGVPRFDVVEEVIEHVLPKYRNNEISIPADENHDDLAKIKLAYDTRDDTKHYRLHKRVLNTAFILCTVPTTGKQEYRTADKVYFRSDELCSYFEGDTAFAYVDVDHKHPHRALFVDVGVKSSVRVKRTQTTHGGHVIYKSDWGHHERGRDGFDKHLEVDGLERALDFPTIDKSAFIWNKIAIPHYRSISGKVESSGRQNYLESTTMEVTSDFGRFLIEKEWLPNEAGKMHQPSDLSIDDLPKSFERGMEAEQLGLKLGMKTEVDAELLKRAGVSRPVLNRVRLYENASPEVQRQIDGLLEAGRGRPDFPSGPTVEDAERRRSGTRRHHEGASRREYEQRARSVRKNRGTIDPDTQLRQWYTNEEDQMVCQICKNEMPFKMRDDEYYFESVEVLSRSYLLKENMSQFLALCPLCAAQYKYFVKRGEGGEEKELHHALIVAGNQNQVKVEVPLKFGSRCVTLRFVPRHVIDLGEILRPSSSSDGGPSYC